MVHEIAPQTKNIHIENKNLIYFRLYYLFESKMNIELREIVSKLPHYAKGPIVKGFGRGSTELGFPTANFSEEVIDKLPQELVGGIYFGFAQVDESPVYDMVMSVEWNPF